MKTRVDELLGDYLARLAAAADVLPADRRAELLAEIRGHIEAARSAGAADEPAVRTLLDRLGEPAEIVAAAVEEPGPTGSGAAAAGRPSQPESRHPAAPPRPARLRLEVAAVVMLTVGPFVPMLGWAILGLLWSPPGWTELGVVLLVFGWLVGVGLLWASPLWRSGEKLLGTLVVPGGPGSIFLLAATPAQTCVTIDGRTTCDGFSLPPAVGVVLTLVVLVGPFVVAGLLLGRARRRAAASG